MVSNHELAKRYKEKSKLIGKDILEIQYKNFDRVLLVDVLDKEDDGRLVIPRFITDIRLNNYKDGGVLGGCRYSEIYIDNNDRLESIKGLCDKINSDRLKLSCRSGGNIKDMSQLFNRATKLVEVDISELEMRNVVSIEEMFRYCENLERLDIGNFRGDSLCNIANMFDGCTSIEYIDINGIDTRYMKELYKSQRKMFNINPLYGVFYDCKSLKGLNVGDGFDPTGGYMVFYGCNNLSLKGVTLNYKGKVGDKVKRVISYGKRGSAGR